MAADEVEDPVVFPFDSMETFRSMVSAADTIEHVVGLDTAFKRLKSAEAEFR